MLDLTEYAQRIAALSESLLTPEALLSTGVITTVASVTGKVAWSAASSGLNQLRSWQLRSLQKHTIALARAQLPFEHQILRPRCLIIRYGTDNYIERLSSDRERHDGRLQNRLIDIPITTHTDGSVGFELRIPVHKRLGTQFKCFVDVMDNKSTAAVLNFLAECQNIASPDLSSSPLHKDRIYFLLSSFATVQSIDGHQNNMCFPE